MNKEHELETFACLVEKVFDPDYLEAMSPDSSFTECIRRGEIYPVKWLLAEADKSKMTEQDLQFMEYLRQKNF
ncbi:hypothetical protein P3T73_13775 [Kiritimatiellota bacterium B12222]|nr:hypothetical protein P3T73_13775 [Kiritimatiellota bacterium B12222]